MKTKIIVIKDWLDNKKLKDTEDARKKAIKQILKDADKLDW